MIEKLNAYLNKEILNESNDDGLRKLVARLHYTLPSVEHPGMSDPDINMESANDIKISLEKSLELINEIMKTIKS